MVDELTEDYIVAAKAKVRVKLQKLFKHSLKKVWLLTITAVAFAFLYSERWACNVDKLFKCVFRSRTNVSISKNRVSILLLIHENKLFTRRLPD